MDFPVGTFAVAKDAVLDFGSVTDRNQFNAARSGVTRLVIDGGEVRLGCGRAATDSGHCWGNNVDGCVAIMEVKNGGRFVDTSVNETSAKMNNFILGAEP